MATVDTPSNGADNSAPGSSFANARQIAVIAIYLVLLGTLSLWMLIDQWPRCTAESAASPATPTSSSKPAQDTKEPPSPPVGTDLPAEPAIVTNTELTTGTEVGATTTGATTSEAKTDGTAVQSPDPVVPKRGPIEGGTPVVLRGSGFLTGAKVYFGESEGSEVEFINAGMITARTPPHAAGLVTVEVTDPGGLRKPLGTYLYGCDPVTGGTLLLLVALAGTLAGTLHAARSLYYYVGNRYFMKSWILMYLILPFVGAALASVFYIVFIAGLYDPQQGGQPLLIVGVAALVGMFSEQAVEKLKKIAEAIFTSPPPAKDKVPTAKVTGISPKDGSKAGGEDVTVTGEGFGAGARVFFGEKDAVTKSIEPTKLVVVTPEHAEGKVNVIVDVPGSSPCAVVNGYEFLP